MTDKPTKKTKTATTKGKAAPQGSRIDWDAIKRDHRTDKFTDIELAARHNVSRETISRKRTADEKAGKKGWEKDLRDAISKATDAALVRDIVTEHHTKVTDVILAAAEVNSRIILGHRIRLVDLASAVDTAKEKLLILGDSVADIREAATFVQAVGNLATATKTLIEQERKAHNLDAEQPKPESEVSTLLQSLGPRSAFQVVK